MIVQEEVDRPMDLAHSVNTATPAYTTQLTFGATMNHDIDVERIGRDWLTVADRHQPS